MEDREQEAVGSNETEGLNAEQARFFDALATVPNKRSARMDDLEVSQWSEGFRFEGHAAVFDEVAEIIPGFATESVERGAFRKVLSLPDNVPMLYAHNEDLPPLATTRGGTLKLEEDMKGLRVQADVADTTLGRDLRVLANRGDVRGMSYGFKTAKKPGEYWTVELRNGMAHRRLRSFKQLLDVSPTWDPTFASASGEFRSLALRYADDPELLQQILMGVAPQHVDIGELLDGQDADERRTTSRAEADAIVEQPDIAWRLAAAKRRATILNFTLEVDE